MRRLITVLCLVAGGLLLAGPAGAIPPGGASADTSGTSASVSPGSLKTGARISYTVKGFPAGQIVYVKIDDGKTCADTSHGACVVAEQKISSSGVATGSFTLPVSLATGAHWLRFLASEPVMRKGEQIGTKGYSCRGDSDFTVVSGATGSGGSTTPRSSTGSASSVGSATPTASAGSAGTAGSVGAGAVVTVAPGATSPTASTASAGARTEAASQVSSTVRSSSQSFPWIGVIGLAGLLMVSFAGVRLALTRKR